MLIYPSLTTDAGADSRMGRERDWTVVKVPKIKIPLFYTMARPARAVLYSGPTDRTKGKW